MDSKLSLNLLRAGLGLCLTFPCVPLAVSQSDPPGVPEERPKTFPGFYGGQLSESEKRKENRIRALLVEVKGIKVAEFVVDEVPLQEALDQLWKHVPPETRYLKAFRAVSGNNHLPLTMSLKNSELGAVLLSLASASGSRVEEEEGVVSYHRDFFPSDLHMIPLKRRTAEPLNLPIEAPPSKVLVDVTGILSQWKIERLHSALYVPQTFTLHIRGSAEEAELLRSVIFMLEQGAVIKFPDLSYAPSKTASGRRRREQDYRSAHPLLLGTHSLTTPHP